MAPLPLTHCAQKRQHGKYGQNKKHDESARNLRELGGKARIFVPQRPEHEQHDGKAEGERYETARHKAQNRGEWLHGADRARWRHICGADSCLL